MPKLPVPERKKLNSVLTELFTNIDDLTSFIRENTGRNVQEIVVGALPITRTRLIDNAEGYAWMGELIEALKDIAPNDARATLESIDITTTIPKPKADAFRVAVQQALPDDELLRILQDRLGNAVAAGNIDAALADAQFLTLAKAVRGQSMKAELRRPLEDAGLLAPTPSNLEKIVKDANSFHNLSVWIERLTEIEGHVCRIAVQSSSGLKAKGSGFLVGPSTVLTNHHVVAGALNGSVDPKRLRVQFDYRVLKDGSTDAGTIVGLDHSKADSWYLDYAKHDTLDTKVHPLDQDPDETNLDYALLRLAEPAGAKPIGPVVGDPASLPKRGWIDLTQPGEKADVDSAIFIVQHPSGLPIKLAFDTESVIGYTPKERRIRYKTNTLDGSSGSPVFNQDLEIIALHHAGDPAYPNLKTGQYNEGIPVPALLKQFGDRGVLTKLAE